MEIPRSYLVSVISKKAWCPRRRIRLSHRCIATHTHSFHADQVSVIRSTVETSSPEFKENEQQMKDAIEKIRDLNQTISKGGSAKAREKHVARGKMLAREYVDL
jgi:3-methylcrotonyl-CoA carboxylase beta subunit